MSTAETLQAVRTETRLGIWPWAGAMALVTAVYGAWLVFDWGGEHVTTAVDDLGSLVAALAGGGLCVWAARRAGGDRRRGWWLLGLAAISWGLGEAAWSYLELLRGQLNPFPSPADAGFLLEVPLAIAGVLQFFRGGRLTSARLGLDGGIIAAALIFVSWVLVLKPTIATGSGDALGLVIGLAYPVGDIVTLVIVFTAVSRGGEMGPLAYVAAGLVALALSDSFFLYLNANGTFATNPVDVGWFAGFLLLGLGGISEVEAPPAPRPQSSPPARVVLPYIPLAAASLLAAVVLFRGGTLDTVASGLLVVLVGLVLLRQVLAVREVGRLSAELARTVARLEEREKDLSYRVLHDPLTHLANRVLFRDRLEHALATGRRHAEPLAVMFLDLDDFKDVNDRRGHEAGDRVLVAAAERIRACVRPGDTVARIGGDEFAVVLQGANRQQVRGIVRRLQGAFNTAFSIEEDFHLGISIGVVMVTTDSEVPAGDLVRRADLAMYTAKATGKNRHAFYDDSMLPASVMARPR